jgi:predicted nucleotide-binding protein
MLSREYRNIVMGLTSVSRAQAHRLISCVVESYKEQIGAIVAAVWVCEYTGGQERVLEPFVDRGDPHARDPERVLLNSQAKGLFAWVIENKETLWLKEVPRELTVDSVKNSAPCQEPFEERHLTIYYRTRSFAAVPIEYRGLCLGVLTVEGAIPGQIKRWHIEALKEIAKPTGALIWKAYLYDETNRKLDQLIDEFRLNAATATAAATLHPYKTGFIARPFGEMHHLIGQKITEAFQRKRIRAMAYQHIPGAGLVVENLLQQINACHFGIADVTKLNHNVFFELGGLLASKKPVIIIRDQNDKSDLPFNIAGYQCYKYQITDDDVRIVDAADNQQSIDNFIDQFLEDRLRSSREYQEALDFEDITAWSTINANHSLEDGSHVASQPAGDKMVRNVGYNG